jgi:methylated-DNA-[protein]-cysteine S-methyltransferase
MQWLVQATPIGDLGIGVDETGLRRVDFGGGPRPDDFRPGGVEAPDDVDPLTERPDPADRLAVGELSAEVTRQLREYFAGELTDFSLPLSVRGGSEFERAVWQAIAAIPYAEMRTYGQIATDVGDREAARAVGIACNRNPLPIVVPCHRVVGAGGKLVGFGGGLPRKRFLLELEAKVRIMRDFS